MLRIHRLAFKALLGIAFVLSVSLSAAQGAGMAMPMTMMAGMAMGDHQDCGGCNGNTDKNGAKGLACAQACLPPLVALLPAELSVAQTEIPAQFAAADTIEWDWSLAPNSSPPRS
jgi:hypothetical protein